MTSNFLEVDALTPDRLAALPAGQLIPEPQQVPGEETGTDRSSRGLAKDAAFRGKTNLEARPKSPSQQTSQASWTSAVGCSVCPGRKRPHSTAANPRSSA